MKFFKKIGAWWQRHKPTKRRLIQVYAALLTNANIKGFFSGRIYTGNTKYACVPGLNCYSCPGAVGACPLGALQNALASSGTSAPYYVFGIIILLGLLLGRTICGFLCPVGLGQELLYKIKTPKLKKSRYTRILSYLKYVLLVVFVVSIPLIYGLMDPAAGGGPVPGFCKFICPAGTFGGAIGLLINPNNADLYGMLGPLFTWKFCLLIVIMVACVFIFRAFCRFLCPLGALYGFFNRIALLGVKLDKNKCTDCGLCTAHCKMDVNRIGDHECINCGECMSVCPAKAISWKGSKLFLHKNAVEAVDAPSEERPLDAMKISAIPVVQPSVAETEIAVTSSAATVSEAVVCETPKKRRGRNFWLQVAAWSLASVVLVGALVYYNFIEKDEVAVGHEVGELAPDFTLSVYLSEEETFTLYDQRGKIVILNFWATWCTPCVAEIPFFEEIAKDYKDDVTVALIHGALITEDVVSFLNRREWTDFTSVIMQDNSDPSVYATFGGRETWPMTIIVDAEGVIYYVKQGPSTYESLKEQIERIKAGQPPVAGEE